MKTTLVSISKAADGVSFFNIPIGSWFIWNGALCQKVDDTQAYDPMGHGTFTMEDFLDDMVTFVRQLNIEMVV
jgi:hypothetical protein